MTMIFITVMSSMSVKPRAHRQQPARVERRAFLGPDNLAARQVQRGIEAAIPVRREDRVRGEGGLHQTRRLAAGAARLNGERLRFDELWRHARPRAPLAGRFAKPPEVELLQIAQTAVKSAVVMKGRAAPEVVTIDQRDVQAARGRVPGGHQAADPAANHQDVESARRQRIEISDHAEERQKPPAL